MDYSLGHKLIGASHRLVAKELDAVCTAEALREAAQEHTGSNAEELRAHGSRHKPSKRSREIG